MADQELPAIFNAPVIPVKVKEPDEHKGFVVYYQYDPNATVRARMLRDLILVDRVGWDQAAKIMNKRLHTTENKGESLQRWLEASETLQELFKKEIDAQTNADMTKAEYEVWAVKFALGQEKIAKGQFDFFELFGKIKGYVGDKIGNVNINQTNQSINLVQSDGRE